MGALHASHFIPQMYDGWNVWTYREFDALNFDISREIQFAVITCKNENGER